MPRPWKVMIINYDNFQTRILLFLNQRRCWKFRRSKLKSRSISLKTLNGDVPQHPPSVALLANWLSQHSKRRRSPKNDERKCLEINSFLTRSFSPFSLPCLCSQIRSIEFRAAYFQGLQANKQMKNLIKHGNLFRLKSCFCLNLSQLQTAERILNRKSARESKKFHLAQKTFVGMRLLVKANEAINEHRTRRKKYFECFKKQSGKESGREGRRWQS